MARINELDDFVSHTEVLKKVRCELANHVSPMFSTLPEEKRREAEKSLDLEIEERKKAIEICKQMEECEDKGMKRILAIELKQIIFDAKERRSFLLDLLFNLKDLL